MARSTLDDRARDTVQRQLQPTLVDLIDLMLTGKQLHWNVTGPLFKPLHEQLDEFVDVWRLWSDDVAERLTAVGVSPDGRVQHVADQTTADVLPEGWIDDSKVVSLLAERLDAFAQRLRERVQEVEDADLATQDLLIEILQGVEQQLWMVSAQQR
jgi:starvation-inducible DNA-binding protein